MGTSLARCWFWLLLLVFADADACNLRRCGGMLLRCAGSLSLCMHTKFYTLSKRRSYMALYKLAQYETTKVCRCAPRAVLLLRGRRGVSRKHKNLSGWICYMVMTMSKRAVAPRSPIGDGR